MSSPLCIICKKPILSKSELRLVCDPAGFKCPHYPSHASCLKKSSKKWMDSDLSRVNRNLLLESFAFLVTAWVLIWDIILGKVPIEFLTPFIRFVIGAILVSALAIILLDIRILSQVRSFEKNSKAIKQPAIIPKY